MRLGIDRSVISRSSALDGRRCEIDRNSQPDPRQHIYAGAAGGPLTLRIGTAGWSLARDAAAAFPTDGSHLERYSAVFDAVEINSTFHRPHRPTTLERWAASVPEHFRFSAKLPREITHTRRLVDAEAPLGEFLDMVAHLGDRLGPLLVQLPPSLQYDSAATAFMTMLRSRTPLPIALEPRHLSWFEPDVEVQMRQLRIARIAADPPRAPQDGRPAGDTALAYFRLHGSPRVYYSAYAPDALSAWAERIRHAAPRAEQVWCIFDNTTLGAAGVNALTLRELLRE